MRGVGDSTEDHKALFATPFKPFWILVQPWAPVHFDQHTFAVFICHVRKLTFDHVIPVVGRLVRRGASGREIEKGARGKGFSKRW